MGYRTAQRIEVSAVGASWIMSIDGHEEAIFTGRGARNRAVESALRNAEDMRSGGPVLVVIATPEGPPRRPPLGRAA